MSVPLKHFGPISREHERLIGYLNDPTKVSPGKTPEYFYTPGRKGDSGQTGRDKMRGVLRALFNDKNGGNDKDKWGTLLKPAQGSIIRQMLMGNDSRIARIAVVQTDDGSYQVKALKQGQTEPKGTLCVLDKEEIKTHQGDAKAYFDGHESTAEGSVNVHRAKVFRDQKLEPSLFKRSYFTTTITPVTQHFAGVNADPVRRLRYLSDMKFPNLCAQKQNGDYIDWHRDISKRNFKAGGADKFKADLKKIIAFGSRSAHHYGVGLALVTPRAFFSYLSDDAQKQAKTLFIQACAEVAQEIDLPNFAGLVLHHDEAINAEDILKRAFEIKAPRIPVFFSEGLDAAALQLASTELGLDLKFADSIQGEPLRSVGNGGLSDSGDSAKDEGDCRESAGESVYTLGAQFNDELLLDPSQYIDVTQQCMSQPGVGVNSGDDRSFGGHGPLFPSTASAAARSSAASLNGTSPELYKNIYVRDFSINTEGNPTRVFIQVVSEKMRLDVGELVKVMEGRTDSELIQAQLYFEVDNFIEQFNANGALQKVLIAKQSPEERFPQNTLGASIDLELKEGIEPEDALTVLKAVGVTIGAQVDRPVNTR